ncbi:MAG: hypothetical protein JW982_01710 [Spirochaetes bacterium]|nr:hypothetical protein [Spirochaetota bacterium]
MKHLSVFILIFTAIISVNLYAGLDDFAKKVEQEKNKNKSEHKSDSYNDEDDEDDEDDNSCGNAIGEAICGPMIEGIIYLWAESNYLTYYKAYPYASGIPQHYAFYGHLQDTRAFYDMKKKVQTSDDSEFSVFDIDLGPETRSVYGIQHFYFNIESTYSYIEDMDYTAGAAVSGKLWRYIGPEIEFRHIQDGDDYLNYAELGINFPVSQYDYFASDFYIQYAQMSGVTDLYGAAMGFTVRSYPYKPFSLSLRTGMQLYQYEIKFYDIEGRIACHFYRFEFFAGYRHIGSDFGAELTGPLCGVKFWI